MPHLLLDTNVLYQVAGPERADFMKWADRHDYQPVVSAVTLWEVDARRQSDPDLAEPAREFASTLPVRPAPVTSLEEGKSLVADLVRAALDADGMGLHDPRELALRWGTHALQRRIATDGFYQLVIDRLGPAVPTSTPDYFGRMLLDLSSPVPPHRNDVADFLIFLSLAEGDRLMTSDQRFAARTSRAMPVKFGNMRLWTS